ncbi:hypothetical protein CHS0354_033773, partial [Potamilus streckersoni]
MSQLRRILIRFELGQLCRPEQSRETLNIRLIFSFRVCEDRRCLSIENIIDHQYEQISS